MLSCWKKANKTQINAIKQKVIIILQVILEIYFLSLQFLFFDIINLSKIL
jgi:hypothetical protein